MSIEIMNKKFTVAVSTIISAVGIVATILGAYWHIKTETELQSERIKNLTEDMVELRRELEKAEDIILRMATAQNETRKMIYRRGDDRKYIHKVGTGDSIDVRSLRRELNISDK